MKFFKHLTLIIILANISISCENKSNSNKEKVIVQTQNYKKMELHIKGMTCEIGCAKIIESKLSKTNGIKFSKVSFIDSIGMIVFDANILSQKDINNVVSKIGGGELYKVTENKIVEEFAILD